MKTLKIFLFGFAILIFSGCYTQLVVENDDPWSTSDQPTYVAPPEPIVIYVPDPQPVYVTGPVTGPYISPGNSNPIAATPVAPPQRTSGDQRSGSDASSQNTNRNSGATRGGGR